MQEMSVVQYARGRVGRHVSIRLLWSTRNTLFRFETGAKAKADEIARENLLEENEPEAGGGCG